MDDDFCCEHGKPFATDDDWDLFDGGEGEHLCWHTTDCVLLVDAPKYLVGEIAHLHEENDELETDLLRMMRQRNARTFAIQCFHGHAVKNGEQVVADIIESWLTAAGLSTKPDHTLIAPLPDDLTIATTEDTP